MDNFIYDIPTKLYFGRGQIAHLTELVKAKGRRVLLVYGGGSIKKIGLYDTILELLSALSRSVRGLPFVRNMILRSSWP